MRYRSWRFPILVLVLAALIAFLAWRSRLSTKAPPPRNTAQVVKTALTQQKSLPITLIANGSVTALNTVEVRPQIQNVVRAVHVREGQDVQAGQLLFTLDARGDESNVAKARAQLAGQRADLVDAEQQLARNQELLARHFVSQAVVDSARNKVNSLRGALHASEAALQASSVAAGYNQIRAGIRGRIGAISVHVGSLAQPAGAPMLTIYQMDPIAVSFAVPEQELPYLRASYPHGDAPVVAQLPAGGEVSGKLIFIDNTADLQSGTILMKSQFANADRKLWPGTFVTVRLTSRTLEHVVTLPAQGVITGPVDKFVYLVQADHTVREQKVRVSAIVNGVAAVTGVPVGARVVIEGAQNLRPGVAVREAPSSEPPVPAASAAQIAPDRPIARAL